jgi:hypothetical protein
MRIALHRVAPWRKMGYRQAIMVKGRQGMSDEQGQAEQPADAWGQPISAVRQAELQHYLDRWKDEVDHGDRRGPFDKQPGEIFGTPLTGA